ncbi:MAG: DUF3486 family protein [Rhodobacter sp.]|nr:DUF3486 family protein [Rhodobacter sp.]
MPPPRKVDLLPPELKGWLQDALRARGFSGYEELAEALNARLEAAGEELRIQKSALGAYGLEFQEYARLQDEAGEWAAEWINDEGMEDEARRHSVLFQMVSTLAFKLMKGQMAEGETPDARDLHFLGKLLKDIMSSSGIRQRLMAEERKRVATEARAAAAEEVETAAAELGLSAATIAAIKTRALGVRT